MTRRTVLAGGGTTGHMNPLLVAVLTLYERNLTADISGTHGGLESDLVPAAGFELFAIDKAPFPRRPNLKVLRFPGKWCRAVAAHEDMVHRAKCVVGFSGYVLTLAYHAATRFNVPIVIYEQNARPGLVSRVGARSAALVALAFDNTPLVARQGRTEAAGLPLRPAIVQLAHKRLDPSLARQARVEVVARLEVNPDLPTLLITGGFPGALSLNRALSQAAERLPEDMRVIHLTGRGKDRPVREAIRAVGIEEHWFVCDYLKTMEDAPALADLVVCHSDAGIVVEMTALGLPYAYVPLPIGNGERRLNVHGHVESRGATPVEDSELNTEYAVNRVFPSLGPERLKTMVEVSCEQGRVHAASDSVDFIESAIEES